MPVAPPNVWGFRQLLLPPRQREDLPPQQLGVVRKFRLFGYSLGFLGNLVIVWSFGDPSRYDPGVLRFFAWYNLLAMAAGFVTAYLGDPERPRRYAICHGICLSLEVLGCVSWIQMTGSTSSYLIVFLYIYIAMARFIFGYRSALYVTLLAFGCHVGVFAVEAFGVLPRASLFVGDGTAATLRREYDGMAMYVTLLLYLFVFLAANFGALRLRAARLALRNAERTLARMMDGRREGRLSGVTLRSAYELSDLIGRGGMGEVYLGRRLKDDRPCAVKVLHPHLVGVGNLRRLEREARSAASLPGTAAPEVLDVCLGVDDEAFLVFELLEGEDLGAFLAAHPNLPVTLACRIVEQTAAALAVAHEAGIAHRDLKPQNVFLEGSSGGYGRVRLLDFGIAKLVTEDSTLTQTDVVVGTPGYIAPERLAKSIDVDERLADVFCLGAIAYECLCGERPLKARSLMEAIHETLHARVQPPSELRPELGPAIDEVVLKALSRDPTTRYQSAAAFASALRATIDGTNTPASIEERLAPTQTGSRRG